MVFIKYINGSERMEKNGSERMEKNGSERMEKFEEAITNYIKKDEKFALFVDGEWGTGKTYYFNNDFLLNDIKKNDQIQYNKELISVYGKQSLNEIQEVIIARILNNIHNPKKHLKKAFKGMNSLLGAIDIPYVKTENVSGIFTGILKKSALDDIKKDLNLDGGKFVLIIDDIERLSENVSIKEFFGFIRNLLLDDLNCKVILVGNKEVLKNQRNEEFNYYWEKVISRNLKFPSNLEVGKKLLEEVFEKDYFEEKEIQEIQELISISSIPESNSNVLNLRTLYLVISDFKIIHTQLEYSHRRQVNTRMSLFTSLFILHNVNRNNEVESEEAFVNLSVPFGINFINSKKDEGEPTKEERIYKNYFEGNKVARNYAYFSSEIKKYILEGYLDVEKYQQQLNDKFSENNVEKDTLNILNEFYLYDEEKIKNEEEEAVSIINENKNSFGYRLNLYITLNILKIKKMLLLKDCDLKKLEGTLLNSYEPQKSNKFEGEMVLKLNNYDTTWSNELTEIKNDLKKKLEAKQSESMINSGIYKQYVEAVLNLDRQKMQKLEQDYKEILFLDIYEKFNEYFNYVEEELVGNNAKIRDLNIMLRSRDVKSINEDSISEFRQNIEQLKTKTKDKISEYNFDVLIKTLDENIEGAKCLNKKYNK